MATFLRDSKLWPEIRARAKKSKTLTIVSAYLGTRPDELLKWPRHAVVVSDLSEATVRRGVCSAKGALRLRKKGATVLQCRDLHAKIYLFDNFAVVASANLSLDSSTKLVEAGVLLTGREVAPVRHEVQRIVRQSVVLDDRVMRQWARVEPHHQGAKGGRTRKQARTISDLLLDGRAVWLLDAVPYHPTPAEEKARASRSKQLSDEHEVKAERIEWLGRVDHKTKTAVRAGEWVVYWWQAGTRAKHGKLEGPFECLAVEDLGKKCGAGRYAVALVPRMRRAIGIDTPRFARMTRTLSRRMIDLEMRSVPARGAKTIASLLAA